MKPLCLSFFAPLRISIADKKRHGTEILSGAKNDSLGAQNVNQDSSTKVDNLAALSVMILRS